MLNGRGVPAVTFFSSCLPGKVRSRNPNFSSVLTELVSVDDRLGTVALPGIEDGHGKMWPKTQKAFKYIWEHHRDDADWFFRADDDSYVFTDNLRTFLQRHDPRQPHYLGCAFEYNPEVVVNLGFSESFCQQLRFRLAISSVLFMAPVRLL